MTNQHRQRYGLGSFIKKAAKKIGKGAKKVWKSPLGKAALLGGGLWGLGKMGGIGSSGIGKNWWSKGLGLAKRGIMGSPAGSPNQPAAGGLWNWIKNNKGQAALLGLGTAGVVAPFLGGSEEDEDVIEDWTMPSAAISGLLAKTKDYYKNYDPASSDLSFQSAKEFVNPNFYTPAAQGGIIGMANGGNPAQAQAEQMLKMEYQKYRNQGGTMSYQQFKMAVLQQAQGQGPMAQGQQRPQGDRPMFQGGELVEDASMVEETPTGMMEENVEEVQGEPTREQMEALAMEIFQLRLEELDEEQLMVVYQAAMEQQPREEEMQEEIAFNPQMEAPQMAANGGRIGFWPGGPAGGASAGGDYGGNVNPQQEYAGRTFQETYGGGNNGAGDNTPVVNTGGNNNLITQKTVLEGPSTIDRLKKWWKGDASNIRNVPKLEQRIGNIAAQTTDKPGFDPNNPDTWEFRSGGRVGLFGGGAVPRSTVPGYTTPPGYNRFNYPSGGVRVGRAEGGLMSLGGMEKDYRQEGGFVPIGGEERADDVPARLSKNEFVFTADAVRAAGGGDIDQGAEVMENVMNNLESGGEISEESQGAQDMYNQQQMLQSRMA